MEEWQEEISYNKPLFFTGELSAKYLGQLNNYLTEKDALDRPHFELSYFYDIQIVNIIKIKEEEYQQKEKAFDIVHHDDSIKYVYKGENFDLKPLELFVLKGAKPDHIQIEDQVIHGYFDSVQVIFKVLKPKTKTVCIEGAITNRKILEDGSVQVTEVIDAETCATKNYIISVKQDQCIDGVPTGRQRTRDGWIEKEYTKGDCSKYWEKLKKVPPPPLGKGCVSGYTGGTRRYQGWLQREYINENCETSWKNDRPLVGCRDILGYILLALTALFMLGLLITLGQIPVIGFILLLVAIGIGLFYLFQFLSRFSAIIIGLFKFLINIAMLGFVALMINGLIQFFKKDHSKQKQKEVIENRSEDKKEIIPPQPIPNEDGLVVKEAVKQIEVNLSWRALDGELYKGSYTIGEPDLKQSSRNIQSLRRTSVSSIGEVYSIISDHDKSRMGSLYTMLDSIKVSNNLSKRSFLDVIVSMVQAQEYVLVLEKNCNDPQILSDRTIRNYLNNGINCESYHPFGLKTPLEFLSNLTGDCDTRTVALYTILKHYNYNVAIINSMHYEHSMLGIDIEGVYGSRKAFGENNYYFWETTSKGFELGFLPHETNRTIFWNVVLN